MDGALDQEGDGSNSSVDDPLELDRIRQWMDHHDWDMLDEPAELRRDKDVCLKLLLECHVRPTGEFELNQETSEECETLDDVAKQRFTNARFLGVGTFGIVFSVHDEFLGMDVAIKLLRPSKSRSRELRARFIGEAQSTASLCHASIVRVYDTGQIGGLPYFTCSQFDSGTLADTIGKNSTALSVRQAAWIVAKVADSVHFAHSKAILHRDLKPSNILLKPSDPDSTEQFGFEPILTDFGLAKRLNQSAADKNLTGDSRVLGTARYMSPEQAKGALSEIGTTSDIFSLGIILYQLLLGRVPFDDPLEQTVRTMIANTEAIAPRRIDPSLPRDLEAVVLKCLVKEPSGRYQSAHELRMDLERFLRGEPVEAEKSTLLRRWQYATRKHPIVATLLLVAVLTNCCAVVGLAIALSRERASKERERVALAEMVSVFTKLGDDIFAGKRVNDDVMMTSLSKSVEILETYLTYNPEDEKFLHRLSVLKHFQSMAYQRLGTEEQFIAARIGILDILGKLIKAHPKNLTYRYQQFHSRMLLGAWMASSSPESKPLSMSTSGIDMLEQALAGIEELATENPEKIEYLDALAATKLEVALQMKAPARRNQLTVEAVSISEQLWSNNPNRLALAKHAIRGLARLALYELEDSEKELAFATCSRAVQLFEKAWAPFKDEIWVMDDVGPMLDVWVDVLIANEKFDQAIKALDEFDGYSETLRAKFPAQVPRLKRLILNGLKRFAVLRLMGNVQAAKEVEIRQVKLIEDSITIEGFSAAIRGMSFPYDLSPRR